MDKTVVVRVERLVQDPRYEKYVRRYSRFMAHDENACDGWATASGSSSTARSRSGSAGRSRRRCRRP
jgi:hypothetical protein